MPKIVKKRKAPITAAITASSTALPARNTPAGSSAHATRTLIRKFHVLLKRQAQLNLKVASSQTASSSTGVLKGKGRESDGIGALRSELKEIEQEMEDLGGLEWYQRASALGQSKERGGDSSHVLVGWLKELKANEGYSKSKPFRVLEIGALEPDNFGPHPWIHNTPLDLHSRHPAIEQQDFMDRPAPTNPDGLFDVVSCSLVLNFVPEPKGRGNMLLHTRSFLHPPSPSSPASYLFLVLPAPCVFNSRYMTSSHLIGLMKSIGYDLVRERAKNEKGVGYWLWKTGAADGGVGGWEKKTLLAGDKGGRNNFSVLL
ncbi:25S rRNA (adenine(2142)-N(1))-methyltransferase, Bmt2 [Phaffia rhodozyma]|uniref:25S rRNA adenine-N(1) methyltransferase n=1 Tax=Phaffia rhodozyma TaxID=264483 RepID=A0A0F7STB2_PHARH|nr:25S rRNA (adenine(2142)-N(1))-methyltransferase, Bmt2 [Phaffia rhodozyma]